LKKRKANAEIHSQLKGGTKFIRQVDRQRLIENELLIEQNKLDEERKNKIQKIEDKLLSSKEKNQNVINTDQSDKFSYLMNASINEVKMRLRKINQPITLFGENTDGRIQRLIETLSKEKFKTTFDGDDEDEFRIKVNKQAFNDKEDQEFEAEDFLENNNNKNIDNNDNNSDSDENEDDLNNTKSKKEIKNTKNHNGIEVHYDPTIQYSKNPNLSKEKVIYKFFRSLIKQWESDLNQREDYEKSIAKGKMETKTQKQCKDYIRPLFRMCKKKTVPYDILQKIFEMVEFCDEGNFRLANDKYISTAIGNSAWPIGFF
jgi:pre-mRNA-splicing factor 18